MTSSIGSPVPLPANHRISETYVDWARALGPGVEGGTRDILERAGSSRHRAWEKPGRFVDEAERLARGLPAAHLPWFWDTIGHWMLETHRRSAARAYGQARDAERTHGLPVFPDWLRANQLLFARFGTLRTSELSGAAAWLAGVLVPVDAHHEFVRLLTAWAASPGELPADLARRVRGSVRAAGFGKPAELLVALRRPADRSAGTSVPPGQYEANPLFSVPDLVDEVGGLSVSAATRRPATFSCTPATRPADRTVRRWNSWSLDHHRAVRKELPAAKAPRPAPAAQAQAPAGVPAPAHERFARAWAESAARSGTKS